MEPIVEHLFELSAGFLLQTPATISVGGKLANITEHERSSIAFTYPELPPGNHSITVDRNGLISNPKNVELLEESAGGGTEQGGPFADTPKYTQKAIPVDVVLFYSLCFGRSKCFGQAKSVTCMQHHCTHLTAPKAFQCPDPEVRT